MAEYFKLVINGGAFVILAWLIRHTFQHTVPRIVDQFTVALKDQQTVFREEMAATRESSAESLRLEREAHTKEVDEFWKYLADQKERGGR